METATWTVRTGSGATTTKCRLKSDLETDDFNDFVDTMRLVNRLDISAHRIVIFMRLKWLGFQENDTAYVCNKWTFDKSWKKYLIPEDDLALLRQYLSY